MQFSQGDVVTVPIRMGDQEFIHGAHMVRFSNVRPHTNKDHVIVTVECICDDSWESVQWKGV